MMGISGLRQFEGSSVSSVRLQDAKQYLYLANAAPLPPSVAGFTFLAQRLSMCTRLFVSIDYMRLALTLNET